MRHLPQDGANVNEKTFTLPRLTSSQLVHIGNATVRFIEVAWCVGKDKGLKGLVGKSEEVRNSILSVCTSYKNGIVYVDYFVWIKSPKYLKIRLYF